MSRAHPPSGGGGGGPRGPGVRTRKWPQWRRPCLTRSKAPPPPPRAGGGGSSRGRRIKRVACHLVQVPLRSAHRTTARQPSGRANRSSTRCALERSCAYCGAMGPALCVSYRIDWRASAEPPNHMRRGAPPLRRAARSHKMRSCSCNGDTSCHTTSAEAACSSTLTPCRCVARPLTFTRSPRPQPNLSRPPPTALSACSYAPGLHRQARRGSHSAASLTTQPRHSRTCQRFPRCRTAPVPPRPRALHGSRLAAQYDSSLATSASDR